MKKLLIASMSCCFAFLIGTGCKKEAGQSGATQAAAPADVSATDKTVNLFIFSDYVPEDVLTDFTKETGIEVKAATFESNEALLTKLSQNNADVDLVSPSDYMVRQLASRGLVRKLDRSKLTNFSSLAATVLGKSFDPANEYSVPLFWGTTGIGYNKKAVTDPVDSWAILFNPKYKNQISMLDDSREVLDAALRVMGKDPNTRDIPTIDAAVDKLRQQHDLVKLYIVDGFEDHLAKGDVSLAQGFNGQFAKVMADNADLAFVVPKEGATLWIDNLSIPTSARRAQNALLLLNFLMRPEIAVRTANFAQYATPNQIARPQVKKELLNNPVIYPPEDVIKRCTMMEDLGPANKRVAQVLQQIKS